MDAEHLSAELNRARSLAEHGRDLEAMELLDHLFVPILERPWIMDLWHRLMRTAKPDQLEGWRDKLKSWIRYIQSTVGEPADRTDTMGDRAGLVSRTLARIYWEQGYKDQSLKMYRALVEMDPHDPELAHELSQRVREVQSTDSLRERTLMVLEDWITRLRQQRGERQ